MSSQAYISLSREYVQVMDVQSFMDENFAASQAFMLSTWKAKRAKL